MCCSMVKLMCTYQNYLHFCLVTYSYYYIFVITSEYAPQKHKFKLV